MPEPGPKASRRALLPIALVLSGFAAVAVEVVWQRLLARILGSSTAALTAVLAAFMGGLALGAALAGPRSDRLDPEASRRLYVRLEVAVWATATVTSLVLWAVPAGVGGALASMPPGAPRFAVRFVVATIVLMIPTTVMGATLPCAVRAAVGGSTPGLLRSAALLYAANTFGAVLGALGAPFLLVPSLGVRGAAVAAAAGSFGAALLARSSACAPAYATLREPSEPTPSTRALFWTSVAASTTGAAALGLEVVWTRMLTTIAGSSIHAFGSVLALVLGGIAIGSAIAAAAAPKVRDPALACSLVVLAGPTSAVLLLPTLDWIPERLVELAAGGPLDLARVLRAVVLGGAAVIVPPAACSGAALPLAIRAARSGQPEGGTARAVGRIYAYNTVGAIAGAVATGLWLIPTIGSGRTAVLWGALAVVAATGLALRGSTLRGRALVLPVALACAAAIALAQARAPDPAAGAGAVHLRARSFRGGDGAASPKSGASRLYFAEGPESDVLVESLDGTRTFYVGGRPEASDDPLDVRNQFLLGFLPAAFAGRGRPRSLVIGLGSGMTAGQLARLGDTLIAELNQTVPGAARRFSDLNHDVLSAARLVIEDGRIVLFGERPGRFDVITTDPIHPYVAGSSSLFATEHLRLCRSRLKRGGAVSEWVPLHQMGPLELRAIVGSFLDVFPDAELYLSRYDAILVGGGSGDRLARLRARWDSVVAADMRFALLGSVEEVAALRVAGPRELARLARGARRNLDDDPWIERTLPAFIYRETVPRNVRDLLALRGHQSGDPLVRAHAAVQRSYVLADSGDRMRALEVLVSALVGDRAPSRELAVRIREVSAMLAADLYAAGRHDRALAIARVEANHPDATVGSLLGVATVFSMANEWENLDALAARLVRDLPERPEGWVLAADSLVARGRFAEAIPGIERAVARDRHRGFAWRTSSLLARAYVATGRIAAGRRLARESLDLRPDQPALIGILKASDAALREMATR